MAFISDTRICRFCHAYSDSLLQYSVRSYAHPSCYLDAGKKLADLHTWQIQNFPWSVLNARNLLEEAERLVAERESPEDAQQRRRYAGDASSRDPR